MILISLGRRDKVPMQIRTEMNGAFVQKFHMQCEDDFRSRRNTKRQDVARSRSPIERSNKSSDLPTSGENSKSTIWANREESASPRRKARKVSPTKRHPSTVSAPSPSPARSRQPSRVYRERQSRSVNRREHHRRQELRNEAPQAYNRSCESRSTAGPSGNSMRDHSTGRKEAPEACNCSRESRSSAGPYHSPGRQPTQCRRY